MKEKENKDTAKSKEKTEEPQVKEPKQLSLKEKPEEISQKKELIINKQNSEAKSSSPGQKKVNFALAFILQYSQD